MKLLLLCIVGLALTSSSESRSLHDLKAAQAQLANLLYKRLGQIIIYDVLPMTAVKVESEGCFKYLKLWNIFIVHLLVLFFCIYAYVKLCQLTLFLLHTSSYILHQSASCMDLLMGVVASILTQ